MREIDRLYLKVMRKYGTPTRFFYGGLIDLLPSGKWRAKGDLWDGKLGSYKPEDTILDAEYDTLEEARAALEALIEKYPVPRSNAQLRDYEPYIIVNDI